MIQPCWQLVAQLSELLHLDLHLCLHCSLFMCNGFYYYKSVKFIFGNVYTMSRGVKTHSAATMKWQHKQKDIQWQVNLIDFNVFSFWLDTVYSIWTKSTLLSVKNENGKPEMYIYALVKFYILESMYRLYIEVSVLKCKSTVCIALSLFYLRG